MKAASSIEVRAVEPEELARFETLLKEGHYLGQAKPVGDFLRQVALRDGQWVGLLVWGPSAYKLKDRERWIGWSVPQRLQRLKLVVQNRRFLLLSQKGRGRTQFGLPGAGGSLQGPRRAVAPALRLRAAFGREFHRSGSLRGDVL